MSHHLVLAVSDGKYPIVNQFSPTEALAPKSKGFTEDNAVVAIAPSITDSFFNWKFVRRGVTLDQKALIATFELVDSDGKGSGYYLSYDYVEQVVVIKKDSVPTWIVSQYTGGATQFQITLITDTTQFLTYDSTGAQVKVSAALTGNDLPKQVWNIAN